MKKNIIYLSMFTIVLLLVACELDYAPENTYVDEKVYRTEKTAEAALAGAYVRLNVFLSGAPQDQNNYSNNGYVFLLADLTTENLKVRENSSSYIAVENSDFSSNEHDGILSDMYLRGYNVIDHVNNIITGIEIYGQYDLQRKQQHIAEARFIRSYVNLMLLCIYGDQALQGNESGDGIVLKDAPYNGYNPETPSGRSKNSECWAHIINDLNAAIDELPEEVPVVSKRVRANKAVAQALLSRVLLYKATANSNKEELQRAAELTRSVIENNGYHFSSSPDEYTSNLFPSNEYSQTNGYPDPINRSEELLFFEPSRLYTANYPNGMNYYRKLAYYIPETVLLSYDVNDVRATRLIVQGSPTDNPNNLTTAKYLGGNYDDVIYIRLAEMKLTYAEALVRTTGAVSQQAIDQLNDVHQRAFSVDHKPKPYVLPDFPNTESFIKAVLKERRLELAYEGHYRWDLIRTDNLLNDQVLSKIPKNRWNLPIPDYEIRLTDKVIHQNSGYQ